MSDPILSYQPSAGISVPDDILCVTISPWEGPRRVRHHLAAEYVRRGHRVIFVEGYLTWVKLLRGREHWRQFARLFTGLRTSPDGVLLAAVPPFLPGGEWWGRMMKFNWWMADWWLRHVTLRSFSAHRLRLLIFAPHAEYFIGRWHERVAIYFCNDPFPEIFAHASARPNLRKMEARLARRVDIVFAVSEQLAEARRLENPNTHLVPLAANVPLFARAMDPATVVPADLQSIPAPRVAYVGVVNNRIDIELTREVARLMQSVSFVFVGPIAEATEAYKNELASLAKEGNVFFLGNKTDEELPGYLKGVEACLIPYVLNDVTRSIQANGKFFQYVASGRPVVSTIGPYSFDEQIILHGTTPETFAAALRRALGMNTAADRAARRRLAQQHSWDGRVDLIESLLRAHTELNVSRS